MGVSGWPTSAAQLDGILLLLRLVKGWPLYICLCKAAVSLATTSSMCLTVNSTSNGSICTNRHTSPKANGADGELIPRVAAQIQALASNDGVIWINVVSEMKEKKVSY